MMMQKQITAFSPVFIVGSPRSGTTLLGEILDHHPRVAQWYEPYFVWDKYFRSASHDERTAADATPIVCNQIINDFKNYKRKKKCDIVIDKSPRNSLKIPFILEIFPNARFIHIVRDGRDVTLSIYKEWTRRKNIVSDPARSLKFDYIKALKVIKKWLARQPFLYDRARALWFETRGHIFDRSKHLNRIRWNGHVGWGPRFENWQDCFEKLSSLEFTAMQWVNCVNSVRQSWHKINAVNKFEFRYEDFLNDPKNTLITIFDFLEKNPSTSFFRTLPNLKKDNFNKWKQAFSDDEISRIRPILTPLLEDLGYLKQYPW